MLLRRIFPNRSRRTRAAGTSRRVGCHEVRGKTLGIVGYGHIGSQLGVLAEAIGMRVIYYDRTDKLPMATSSRPTRSTSCSRRADFVTLHVPETPETAGHDRRARDSRT